MFPIAVDTDRITNAPRRPALENVLQDEGWLNFLFVGRIVPNKKIEDHIKLAEHYKRYVDEQYRFIFVGKTDATPRYYNDDPGAARARIAMPPGRFIFTGPVPDEDLATYYRTAQRLHLAVGARRLLRAAARSDGRRRAGAGLRRRRRCPTRLAARACSSRRRISNMRRSSSASSPTTTACGRRSLPGSARRLADFGDDRIRKELERLTS